MTDPRTEWQKLLHDADQLMWTSRAVVQLLEAHQPNPEESHSVGWICHGCFEIWPCTTYETIRVEACHHG